MTGKYQLRQQLEPAHSEDVKTVLALSDSCIASGSRDGTVAIWKTGEASASADFKLKAILGGHGAYVNSLAHIPGAVDGDLIASGGNSSMILLHSLDTLEPESTHALLGHALNVCTLAYSRKRKRLISGSWDKTARVWVDRRSLAHIPEALVPETSGQHDARPGDDMAWETELVLEGHDEAVWGVAVVEEGPKEGYYLTGSADRLINLWNDQAECVARFKGSPEPVRSLSMFPDGERFASACNDGLVRVWDMTGSILSIFKGHTDYVYDVVVRGREVLSCGEDHTARIWQDDGSHESMLHPCQTVWNVDSLPNGDIVTAGSDGSVRIWSSEEGRKATLAIRAAYEAEVQAAMQKPSDTTPASAAVDGSENPELPMTIDIDISDDDPPIPLTFSPGDDPAEVARLFGQDHSLSDNYVRQITEFIELHLGQIKLETVAPDDKDDSTLT